MGSMADYLENQILDHILRNEAFTAPATVYSALFTVIPSDSTAGTEVTNASSGYTRVATTFTTAGATATGQAVNSGAVSFVTVAAGATITVVGWGLLDTSTVAAGNLLYWATVTSTALNVGDQATFPAGNITVTQD
jgi:hypothetical protein